MLYPIEHVVKRVAGEVPMPVRNPEGQEVYSSAAQLVAEMIAESAVPAYLCSPVSGQVWALPPLAAGGYTAFDLHLEHSLAVFMEPFEPFGATWPNPDAETVMEWVEAWRFAKELGDATEALISVLGDGEDIDDFSEFEVDTPVYCVCIAEQDGEALVQACTDEAAAQSRGDATHRPRAQAPAEPLPTDGSPLNTQQAARYLGFKPYTMRRWRSEGKGPRYVKGEGRNGRVLYLVEELEAWRQRR